MAKPKFLKLFSEEANYPGLVKNYVARVKAKRIINFLQELYTLGKKMMMEIALGEDEEDSEPKHQKLLIRLNENLALIIRGATINFSY